MLHLIPATLAAPAFSLQPVLAKIVTHWAWNKWFIILCFVIAALLVVNLYKAQQKIASARAVKALTAIRVLLVLLTFALLAGLGIQWTRTGSSGGTLWLVVDQSGSMARSDAQATPVEKLRWADSLGYVKPELRPVKLDRHVARLQAIRSDLVYEQTVSQLAVEASEVEKRKDEFLAALKKWNKDLTALADALDKEPALKSGDGAPAAKGVREASAQMTAAIDKADDRARPDEAANDVPWVELRTKLDGALAVLKAQSDLADQKFIGEKGSDPAVVAAMDRVGKMSRADLAFATLTEKSKHGGSSIVDIFGRQTTKIVSFADAPQLVEVNDVGELSKALKDAQASGKSTNVAAALQFIGQQLGQDEPASVVVWSDGRQNVGGDLVEPARTLAARKVRVFTLGLGSEQVVPDAAVERVDAPDWIFKDDTLKASALLRLDGMNGKPVKVEFRRGEQLLESETKTVTPTQDRDTKVVSFSDKPTEPGVFQYSVRVVPLENEAVKENNGQDLRVSVRKDKLNVLMIEDQPRWEFRYLANYLQRDQRVKLQTLLLQPAVIAEVERGEARKASPKNDRTEADLLPEKREEWAAFDMIVVGDVPKERLNEEAQKNIVAAVKDRGATLLLMAGPFHMPGRFGGTALQEVLPVDLTAGGGWSPEDMARHTRQGFRPTVAPEGVESVMSQFAIDDAANDKIWASLPPFYWHSEFTNVRAANVIWSIEDYKKPPTGDAATAATGNAGDADANVLERFRKRALLSTSGVGTGRVMYLASDQTWRLRQVNGLNLHERLWGQVIRWVVGSDMPAGGRFVRFGTNKPRYVAGEPVIVSSRLLGEDFAPLKGEKVKIVAKLMPGKDPKTGMPSGEGKVVAETTLTELADTPGRYTASLGGLPAGAIELSVQGDAVDRLYAKDDAVMSKALHVDIASQLDVEQRNVNTDRAALSTVANAGSGIALDAAYADVMAEHVPALNYTTDSVEQFGLFADPKDPNTKKAHWIFLGLFVVLVSAEWIIRKSSGLV